MTAENETLRDQAGKLVLKLRERLYWDPFDKEIAEQAAGMIDELAKLVRGECGLRKDAGATETIAWRSVADELPDDDTTVLIHVPESSSEPMWLGYYMDSSWYSIEGCDYEGLSGTVTHWAPMPRGPV